MLRGWKLVVIGGSLFGGFVSGLAGFGTGLVALGIWLHVLDPATAVSLVVLCSVVAQVQTIRTVWHAINWSRIWPMLVAGLIGVPIGTRLLAHLDPAVFRLAMGILLIGYSTFMLLGRHRPPLVWGGRAADAVVGFGGGVLGGLISAPALGFMVVPAFLKQGVKDHDIGPISDFPDGTFVIATFMLDASQGEVSRRTAYVRSNGPVNGQPSFTIISNHCAHLGCPVQPNGPLDDAGTKHFADVTLIPTVSIAGFGCPCHGG